MRNLEYKRREHGWSQTQLARRANLSQNLVSLAEAGRFQPTAKQLARLARVLGIPASAVMEPTVATIDLPNGSDEATDSKASL